MPACRYRSGSIWQPLFVLGVCLVLAVRLFRQVSQYAVNIFFSDQWAIHEATLFQKHTLWEMFRWRYDAHRLGVGGLLAYFLEPHFHWNSRGEAFLATAIVTIAAFCALYLKSRLWGPIRLFDLAIPMIFLTPAQYESLWVTPDYAHGPLPLLLVVLYCVAITCKRAAVRYTLLLIVNFLAIYTGYGLLMGIITPAWLMLEYYSQRAARRPASIVLLPFALSVVSLASFLVGYVPETFVDCASPAPRSPVTYFTFFLGMLAHNFGARGPQIISIPLGAAALTAMIFVLIAFGKSLKRSNECAPKELVPAVLVGFCLLFCAATAFGRACLGSNLAFESRYTNYLALGILGVYFYFLSARGQWKGKVLLYALLALLSFAAAPTLASDRSAMQRYHDIKSTWRNCYLKTEKIHECDQEAGFWIYPFPEGIGLKAKLEYLKHSRQNLYSDLP